MKTLNSRGLVARRPEVREVLGQTAKDLRSGGSEEERWEFFFFFPRSVSNAPRSDFNLLEKPHHVMKVMLKPALSTLHAI